LEALLRLSVPSTHRGDKRGEEAKGVGSESDVINAIQKNKKRRVYLLHQKVVAKTVWQGRLRKGSSGHGKKEGQG